jgi:hypothetical protein
MLLEQVILLVLWYSSVSISPPVHCIYLRLTMLIPGHATKPVSVNTRTLKSYFICQGALEVNVLYVFFGSGLSAKVVSG